MVNSGWRGIIFRSRGSSPGLYAGRKKDRNRMCMPCCWIERFRDKILPAVF